MSEKLRFGVIGAGSFAEVCHVPGLQAAGAEVVAIAGRRRERARALAERFGIRHVEPDAAALCAREDLDGVAICTPNDAHREAALLAFAHRKHVLCEKPLALDVADAEPMLAAADTSGRVHQVAFTYRYLHGVAELRRRVAAGDVGEPYLFRGHHEFWDGLRPGATARRRSTRPRESSASRAPSRPITCTKASSRVGVIRLTCQWPSAPLEKRNHAIAWSSVSTA